MRVDKDFLGKVELPDDVYYGIQTHRAISNFDVSNTKQEDIKGIIANIAIIKKVSAITNNKCGVLSDEICKAVVFACDEVIQGKLSNNFPIDIVQGGGGTSLNMNLNEVIACRANEIITGKKGHDVVHPNRHINLSQSTNDVIPAAMTITTYYNISDLLRKVEIIETSFSKKMNEYRDVIKLSRTCIQDALPITFGQYFSGYVGFIGRIKKRLESIKDDFLVLPLGATAVGTGLGSPANYDDVLYDVLHEVSNTNFIKDDNFFDGLQNADVYIEISGLLKILATGLSKVARDFRMLSSGPNGGINELIIPAVQPGSSIMPGKVNPSMPELMNQVAYQVCGNDTTITMAVEGGELDLNVWEPIIIKNLDESFLLLTNSIELFATKCIDGIRPNIEVCERNANNTVALSTIISSIFGYETGTKVALRAFEESKSVKSVVKDLELMTQEHIEEAIDPYILIDRERSASIIEKYKSIYNETK